MKTKTTAYAQLADLCDVHNWHLEITTTSKHMELRVRKAKDSTPISTPFQLRAPDAAAERLLGKL